MEHSTKTPRPAWYAMPVDAWPDIAEALPRPWGRGAILADLAWWQDLEWRTGGRQRRPARRHLMSRWGVSDWIARRALRATALWMDPRKETNQQPTKRPPETNQRDRDVTTLSGETPPETNQTPSQKPPHARIETHTQTSTSKDVRVPRSALEGWTEAVDLWRDLGPQTAKGKPTRRRPRQSKGVGRALASRLRDEGVADVLHVIRWAHESDDERARFLRGARTPRDIPDRGKVSLVTLMRPTNFEVYRDMAATWAPHTAQQAPEPSTEAPGDSPPLPRRRRHYWAASND